MTGQKYNSYNLVSKFIQKNKKLKIKYLGKVSFKIN